MARSKSGRLAEKAEEAAAKIIEPVLDELRETVAMQIKATLEQTGGVENMSSEVLIALTQFLEARWPEATVEALEAADFEDLLAAQFVLRQDLTRIVLR